MFLLLLGFCLVTFSYAQYCSCGPTTTVDSNLGPVTLNGDTRSISDNTNCPGFIGPKDMTSMVADLTPSYTYWLSYTITTCGNSFPTLAAAWIDYNQDYKFSDDERLGVYSTAKSIQVYFTVPASYLVVPGATRLRVQVQETQSSSINPCASFPYGGTKDFTVTIGSGSSSTSVSTGGLSTAAIGVIIAVSILACILWSYFRRRAGGSCFKSSSSYQAFNNPPSYTPSPAYTPSPYVQPATAPAYGYVPPAACYRCSGQKVVWSQCQACGGVGFVQATVAFQTRTEVEATVMRVECPTCKGKGTAPSSCPSCCL